MLISCPILASGLTVSAVQPPPTDVGLSCCSIDGVTVPSGACRVSARLISDAGPSLCGTNGRIRLATCHGHMPGTFSGSTNPGISVPAVPRTDSISVVTARLPSTCPPCILAASSLVACRSVRLRPSKIGILAAPSIAPPLSSVRESFQVCHSALGFHGAIFETMSPVYRGSRAPITYCIQIPVAMFRVANAGNSAALMTHDLNIAVVLS